MAINLVVAILVFSGVAVALLSAIGIVAARNPFDRLHFAGPAGIMLPILFAAGMAITASSTQSIVKGMMLAIIFLIANPILAHATCRAFYRRQHRIRPTGRVNIN